VQWYSVVTLLWPQADNDSRFMIMQDALVLSGQLLHVVARLDRWSFTSLWLLHWNSVGVQLSLSNIIC